jgi:hypothetical protein
MLIPLVDVLAELCSPMVRPSPRAPLSVIPPQTSDIRYTLRAGAVVDGWRRNPASAQVSGLNAG